MKSINVLIMGFDWSVSENLLLFAIFRPFFRTQKSPKSLRLIGENYFKNINTNCAINRLNIQL